MIPQPLLADIQQSALRQKRITPPYSDLWNYMVSRWEGIAARVAEAGKPFDDGALAWHGITPMVVEAAVIWKLSDRQDARDYALERIRYFLDIYKDCGSPDEVDACFRKAKDHTGRAKVLSHGETALAADIMRDSLPEEMRTSLAGCMRNICIPYYNAQSGLAGYGSGGNPLVCQNINAGICALTWGTESGFEHWEAVVDVACDHIRQYLRNGCDGDGFSYEGTGYGEQVMQFIFLFCHLLRQARWHDDLLVAEPRLRRIPDAFQHMLLPDGRFAATTNDAGAGCRAPMSMW